MKKKLLLSLTLLFFAFFASAQRTTTLFQKTYKVNVDSASLSFQSVARTKDGGYAFLGNFDDRKKNFGDMTIIRTDSLGTILWSTNLNSDTTEAGTGIRATPDGGFIVSGWNSPPNNFSKGEMLLAKVDSVGNLKWTNQFGGTGPDEAGDLAVLNSGDIAIAGRAEESNGSRSAYYLLTKANGNPENGQFVRFGEAQSSFNSMDKTSDGGSIASGFGGSLFQPTSFDPILVKFNAQGAVVWGKRYATKGTQFNSVVRQTKDLGFITIGQQAVTQPNGQVPQTFYIIKTNALGDTLWCKAYDTGKFEFAKSVADVGDGYIISGYTTTGIDTVRYKTPEGRDTFVLRDRSGFFAMKIDQLGSFKWGKTYGDSTKIAFAYGSVDAYDGGVTIVGETFGYGNTFGAGYVIHTDREGNIGAGTGCQIRNLPFTTTSFQIKDSVNVVVIEGGEEFGGYLRRQAISITKSDICSGTGLFTDVADYRLPENAVKIYPNPVNTQLFVEIAQNTEGSLSTSDVKIFDATGRLIQAHRNVNDLLQVDVSAYARGIYILKVERNGKYLTKKFVVE